MATRSGERVVLVVGGAKGGAGVNCTEWLALSEGAVGAVERFLAPKGLAAGLEEGVVLAAVSLRASGSNTYSFPFFLFSKSSTASSLSLPLTLPTPPLQSPPPPPLESRPNLTFLLGAFVRWEEGRGLPDGGLLSLSILSTR